MTTKTDEQERAEFMSWLTKHYYYDDLNKSEIELAKDAWDAGRAALQSQDREDALIEVLLEACDEWSQYVEVDTAPRTLREHIQLAIDHARRIEGEGE